jgi:hypothetical protein
MPTVQAGEYVRVIKPMTHGELHPTRRRFLFRDDLRVGDVIEIIELIVDRMYFSTSGSSVNWVSPREIEPCPPPPPTPHRSLPAWGWSLIPASGASIALAAVNKEKIMQFDLGSIADSPIVHTSVSHAIAATSYGFIAMISLLLLKGLGGILGKAGDYRRRVAEWRLEDGIKRDRLSDERNEMSDRRTDREKKEYERREEESRRKATLDAILEILPIIRHDVEGMLRVQATDFSREIRALRESRVDIRPQAMGPLTPEHPAPTGEIKPGMWAKCITDYPVDNPRCKLWNGKMWSFRTMRKGDCVCVSHVNPDGTFGYMVPPDMEVVSAFQKDFAPV